MQGSHCSTKSIPAPPDRSLHVYLQDERAQPGQGLSHAQPLITCQDNRQVLSWFLNAEQYIWYLSCPSARPFGKMPSLLGATGTKISDSLPPL